MDAFSGGYRAFELSGDRHGARGDLRFDPRRRGDGEVLFGEQDLAIERALDGEIVIGGELPGNREACGQMRRTVSPAVSVHTRLWHVRRATCQVRCATCHVLRAKNVAD